MPQNVPGTAASIESVYISDIRSWMLNMKLNDTATEYILFSSAQQLIKCTNMFIYIGDSVVQTVHVIWLLI